MAQGLEQFAAHLREIEVGIVSEFNAEPYYEPHTDSIIFYLRDTRSYSQRVTKFFTLFLDAKDNSLVGFEIKGITILAAAVEGLGNEVPLVHPVQVTNEDGEEGNLEVLVRQSLVPAREWPVEGELREQLRKAVHGRVIPRMKNQDACGA